MLHRKEDEEGIEASICVQVTEFSAKNAERFITACTGSYKPYEK